MEPDIIDGARAPLFDRLTKPGAEAEVTPFRVLDKGALVESVIRELDRLLNTRAPLLAETPGEGERTTLDYGVVDVSAYSPAGRDDQLRLRQVLASAISAFEPRLRNVRINVEGRSGYGNGLKVTVSGRVVCGSIAEPVSFPVLIRGTNGADAEASDAAR